MVRVSGVFVKVTKMPCRAAYKSSCRHTTKEVGVRCLDVDEGVRWVRAPARKCLRGMMHEKPIPANRMSITKGANKDSGLRCNEHNGDWNKARTEEEEEEEEKDGHNEDGRERGVSLNLFSS